METTKLRELIQKQQLVTLSMDQTVESVLDVLGRNNISSAPILGNDGKPLGFVDVLDLLAFMVRTSTKPLTDTLMGESRKLTSDDMQMLRKRTKDFKLQAVSDLIDFSRRNPYHAFYEDQTVADTLSVFQKGVHRVALLDRNNKLIGVVSQFDIIQRIAKDQNIPALKMRVSESSGLNQNLMSVPLDTLAIDAFITMYQQGVSSLALLDNQGIIVGTVTASDVKWITKNEDFRALLHSIRDYVVDIRKAQGKSPDFVACTLPTASIFDIINLMYQERVHRVFVVDERRKPKGVISLTDILRDIGTVKTA